MAMTEITSWGRLGRWKHDVQTLTSRYCVMNQLNVNNPGIAQGMGRSYGDVCLNPNGALWKTTGLDRFISFDEHTGRLVCEAGVLLRDIQRLSFQCGWALPVTPGTQLVTLGGAVANDVHGKNHHRLGSFGNHIHQITLQRTDGEIIKCGPNLLRNWFSATVGGIGLTGLIVTVDLQLRRVAGPWIDTETIAYGNLDEFFWLADDSEADWEHTVSWIDCLSGEQGRGLFMRSNYIQNSTLLPYPRHISIPFSPPFSIVNNFSLRLFNTAYFNIKKWTAKRSVVPYESSFYPLDNFLEWNKIYGPKGFYQYQSVVPKKDRKEVIQAMLREIARFDNGSFLAVLKTFGTPQPVGMLSFVQPTGITLSLDFPNKGEKTLKLFERLDSIISEAHGRIYLAKDARMSRRLFESGYPRHNEFKIYRDPGITSSMSRRLMGK
jgi:FAD/FMN-containing dehydrogenase